jgi:predicted ester cyclase
MNVEQAIPVLPADDLGVARAFYVEKLGFEVLYEASEDGRQGLLGLARGPIRITLDCPMEGHGRNACVSLEVDDVDAYYAEWSPRVDVLRAPRDEPWGARTFDLSDPFGNTLFVMGAGESMASRIRRANAGVLVEGRLEAADEFFAPGYVAHATDRDLAGGPAAVRGYVATLRQAFPDLGAAVEILVESGDRIAWQRTVSGTQSGAFLGFPPSNRRVVWRDMVTSRFRDGRIAEDWVVTDLADRLLRARKG